MKRLLYKKLNNRRGLTLVELLATVLILLLATSIAATGIPSAKAAYDKAVDASNAQVLLSITVTELRRELGLASKIPNQDFIADSTKVDYISGKNGGQSQIRTIEKDGVSRIYIQEMRDFLPDADKNDSSKFVPLVSIGNDDSKLSATYEKVSFSNGAFIVSNLEVKKNGNTLAKLDTLTIHTINE